MTFIDSSGIGAIVFLFKRLAARRARLVVTGLGGQPLQMFKLLRLDRSIPTEPAAAEDQA